MGEVDHRPDRRLAVGFGGALLTMTIGPAVWGWSVRDRLPDPVARHWGTGGQVTGTWSLPTQLLVLGALTVLVAGAVGALAVLGRHPVTVRRVLAACGVWTATILAGAQVEGLRVQLDLADAFAAPPPGVGLAWGAVLGLVLGCAVAAMATEAAHARRADRPPDPALPRLAQGSQRPAYTATSKPSPAMLSVVSVAAVGFALPAVFGWWWLAVVGATVLVPVIAMARFSTTIDGAGLRVRAAGVTLVHVPVDQVEGASVIDHLDAFWEFGGWGLRVDARGRTGVVAASGPALCVARADGSDVVVTLADPHTAAAALNTIADRHHEARTDR